MGAVEIVLIVAAIIMMIGSFFVTEKLSQTEVGYISELSSQEMKRILEKNMESAEQKVEVLVDDVIDKSMEIVERAMERETNLKIQAISEYSDTVIETIQKTHNEILFLYNMLNEKHAEMTENSSNMQKMKSEMARMEENIMTKMADIEKKLKNTMQSIGNTSVSKGNSSLMQRSTTQMASRQVTKQPTTTKPKAEPVRNNTQMNQPKIEAMKEKVGTETAKPEPNKEKIFSTFIKEKTAFEEAVQPEKIPPRGEKETIPLVPTELVEPKEDVISEPDETVNTISEEDFTLFDAAEDNSVEDDFIQEDELMNHNQYILKLHQQGMSLIEIARKLGLGLGEVKLVIDLYREESL
jgi:hypothetical protein